MDASRLLVHKAWLKKDVAVRAEGLLDQFLGGELKQTKYLTWKMAELLFSKNGSLQWVLKHVIMGRGEAVGIGRYVGMEGAFLSTLSIKFHWVLF